MFETGYILLDLYLFLILIVKLINIFVTLFQKLIIKSKIINESSLINIQKNLNNIINILMSILLIVLFKPFGDEIILTKHIKIFIFTFGILGILQFVND